MTSRRKRTFKAYWTSFRVAWSYFWAFLLSKVLGKGFYQRRLSKLHHHNALLVKKTILDLGGLFVKAGQLISILSNVLPKEFRDPLESLQNKVPPRDPKLIRQHLTEELGKPIDTVFKHFEDEPLAAASIGQAHRAQLLDGTEVVVKIQHHNIEEIANIDLDIIEKLVKLHNRILEVKGIEHVYKQVRQMIQEELDYMHEAEVMQTISRNIVGDPRIKIPKAYAKHSSKQVIVSEFCEGVRITDIDQIEAWNLDREDLARQLIRVYCQMIFTDGLYHADPHPGNVLVNKKGKVILLDFGAVSEISPRMQEGIMDLTLATAKNDLDGIVDAMRKAGFVGDEAETIRIAERLIEIGSDFFENEVQFNGLNLKDIDPDAMFKVVSQVLNEFSLKELANTFQIPKDWILLNRTMVLIIGICDQLAPHINPIELSTPYIKEFLLSKRGKFSEVLLSTLQNQVTTVLSLPNELRKVLQKTQKGRVELKVNEVGQGFRLLYTLGQQVLSLSCFLGFFYLAYADIPPFNAPAFSYGLLFFGIVAAYKFIKISLKGNRLFNRMDK